MTGADSEPELIPKIVSLQHYMLSVQKTTGKVGIQDVPCSEHGL